jgi:hypothetical protein
MADVLLVHINFEVLLLLLLKVLCITAALISFLPNVLIQPSGLASSCAPSSQLCTDFLCLLAVPLGFEDLPPDISVDARLDAGLI